MRLASCFTTSPLLFLSESASSWPKSSDLPKGFFNYWYFTIYLLKTGFAKRPKSPV